MIDIYFNLIGMIFFVLSLIFFIPIYFKQRSLTNSLLIIIIIGGIFFTLSNVIEKTVLIEEDLADELGECIGIFFVTIFMMTGFVSILEKKLKSYHVRLQRLIEQNPDPIILLDKNGDIIYINIAAEESLDTKTRNFTELLIKLNLSLNKKKREIKLSDKKGKLKIFEMHATEVIWKKNLNLLITFRDITERMEMFQSLTNLNQQSNLLKDLLGHDINNILQSILSGIEIIDTILNDSRKYDEINNIIKIIKNQVLRGANLISNSRKFTEISKDFYKIPIENLNICECLKKSIKFTKEIYPNKNIHIFIDSEFKNLMVRANELLLDVFQNILTNAIIHNKNTIIEIKIKIICEKILKENILRLEFIDNAIGIEDSRKEQIFERVFDQEKSKFGMGFGLSLVKKIIEGYNGKIWVENSVKDDYAKGSNFIIQIPQLI